LGSKTSVIPTGGFLIFCEVSLLKLSWALFSIFSGDSNFIKMNTFTWLGAKKCS
jgi:hypothetical protein